MTRDFFFTLTLVNLPRGKMGSGRLIVDTVHFSGVWGHFHGMFFTRHVGADFRTGFRALPIPQLFFLGFRTQLKMLTTHHETDKARSNCCPAKVPSSTCQGPPGSLGLDVPGHSSDTDRASSVESSSPSSS